MSLGFDKTLNESVALGAHSLTVSEQCASIKTYCEYCAVVLNLTNFMNFNSIDYLTILNTKKTGKNKKKNTLLAMTDPKPSTSKLIDHHPNHSIGDENANLVSKYFSIAVKSEF